MLPARPAYDRASCRATTMGEACLSVARTYLPTVVLLLSGCLPLSSEKLAATLPDPLLLLRGSLPLSVARILPLLLCLSWTLRQNQETSSNIKL